ncbi:MAG: S8 family serine peptidase [Cyanobacteria bacterium J06600_6]
MTNSDFSEGRLLGFETTTLDEVFDRDSGTYYLYPEAPMADEVQLSGVKWGMIDSGVLRDHPQLKGLVIKEKDFTGEGIADEIGHGTQVALIGTYGDPTEDKKPILQVPGLISAKVASRDGTVDKKKVIRAIHWVAKQGVQIINLSLGFEGSAKKHQDLCKAISAHPNIIFCAAAGNLGVGFKVCPASCDAENLVSVSEMIGEELAPHSGIGDVGVNNPPAPVSPTAYYFGLGLKAAKANRLEQAEKLFYKTIEIDSSHIPTLCQLGLIAISRQDYDTALEKFMQAYELDSSHSAIMTQLGTVWLFKNNLDKAQLFLQQATKADPPNALAHKNLSVVWYQRGDLQNSLKELELVKKVDPNYPDINQQIEHLKERLR